MSRKILCDYCSKPIEGLRITLAYSAGIFEETTPLDFCSVTCLLDWSIKEEKKYMGDKNWEQTPHRRPK